MEAAPEAAPAAAPAAAAPAGQQSALLRCLSQLNDDVLTAHLLPKLVEQGSAGAVVLTCSQLRRLFQPSIQHLDLTRQLQDVDNPCHSPQLARQLVAAFPSCTSLAFAWASSSMVNVYRSISPLLAGLPALSSISIKLDCDSEEGDLDPVLALIQLHATGMQSLSLQLDTSWVGHDSTWASLGKVVSLTKLQLTFDSVSNPCNHRNLRLLTGLSKLQSLCVREPIAGCYELDVPTAPELLYEFPGRLTSLTELQLPVEVMQDLSSVSECVGLRDLQLHANIEGAEGVRLKIKEWERLVQLTNLTRLHVDGVGARDDRPFYGVLGRLKGLRVVGANGWVRDSLLVLQSLTRVTAVHGDWSVGDGLDLSGLVCPHIRELGDAYDRVPWQAFPNLTSLTLLSVSARNVRALSSHCTGLQKVVLCSPWEEVCDEPVSMFRPLAHLQHLTHLELPEIPDAQLIAFTSAVAAAGMQRLRYLRVLNPVAVCTLMNLLNVRGVKEVTIDVWDDMFVGPGRRIGDQVTHELRALLVGLAHVPKVVLVVAAEAQRRAVEDARRWATREELPLPAVLKVSFKRN